MLYTLIFVILSISDFLILSFRSSCQDFRCSNHTHLNQTAAYTNNYKPCILLRDSSNIFNTKIDSGVV